MPPRKFFKNCIENESRSISEGIVHTSTLQKILFKMSKESNTNRTYRYKTFSYIYKVKVINLLLVSVQYHYMIQALLAHCCSCIIFHS